MAIFWYGNFLVWQFSVRIWNRLGDCRDIFQIYVSTVDRKSVWSFYWRDKILLIRHNWLCNIQQIFFLILVQSHSDIICTRDQDHCLFYVCMKYHCQQTYPIPDLWTSVSPISLAVPKTRVYPYDLSLYPESQMIQGPGTGICALLWKRAGGYICHNLNA